MLKLARECAAIEHRYDLALMEPTILLPRMERYALALQLQAAHARHQLTPSRGKRPVDIMSAHLARYLFEWWLFSFGSRPSVNPDSEFHRVAQAVGELYGIKIGTKSLKKASTDPPS
jgi:hypothetical protein